MSNSRFLRWQWAWRRGWLAWTVFAVAMACSICVLVIAHQSVHYRVGEAVDLEQQIRRALQAQAPRSVPLAETARDFTARLGAPVSGERIARQLQRSAASAGLQLSSLQIQEASPTSERLGRLEVVLTFRSGYVGIKQVLADTIDRHPNATVTQLRMRRASAQPDLETQITLSFWSAPWVPLAAASGGR